MAGTVLGEGSIRTSTEINLSDIDPEQIAFLMNEHGNELKETLISKDGQTIFENLRSHVDLIKEKDFSNVNFEPEINYTGQRVKINLIKNQPKESLLERANSDLAKIEEEIKNINDRKVEEGRFSGYGRFWGTVFSIIEPYVNYFFLQTTIWKEVKNKMCDALYKRKSSQDDEDLIEAYRFLKTELNKSDPFGHLIGLSGTNSLLKLILKTVTDMESNNITVVIKNDQKNTFYL